MRTLIIACGRVLTGTSHVAVTGEKLCTIAIDRSWSFDANVLGVGRGDHYDVAVTRRNIVADFVVLDLWATKQTSFGGQLQRDIALEFNGAGYEIAGWDQNSSAVFVRAGVDRFLDGAGVNGRSITDSAEVNNVINVRAKILLFRSKLSGYGAACNAKDRSSD